MYFKQEQIFFAEKSELFSKKKLKMFERRM